MGNIAATGICMTQIWSTDAAESGGRKAHTGFRLQGCVSCFEWFPQNKTLGKEQQTICIKENGSSLAYSQLC